MHEKNEIRYDREPTRREIASEKHSRYIFWFDVGVSYASLEVGIRGRDYLPFPYNALFTAGFSGLFIGLALREFSHFINPTGDDELSKREISRRIKSLFLGTRDA